MTNKKSPVPDIWITGLGTQYPAHLIGPEKLDKFAERFHDVEAPGYGEFLRALPATLLIINNSLKKLLKINRSTGIRARSAIRSYDTGYACQTELPTLADMDQFYRIDGVNLTVQACEKALREWGGKFSDITHTVGVTCTSQGLPGYDLLVNRKLDLSPTVDRTLLHGVGCAGGLAIMRIAAQLACGATMRRRPARILAFACELCTPNVRFDLAMAEQCVDPANVSIVGAIFSDAAAAFVLCNTYGMGDGIKPKFQLLEWGNALIPDTTELLTVENDPSGYRTVLSRHVPTYTKKAIGPLFAQLLPSFREKVDRETLNIPDFDWALHPGGEAIIHGAAEMLGLTDEQLRATREIYATRGNSSSPSVLAVLDKLRTMGTGRDFVVATSFGPGLAIEMSMLRRCRDHGDGSG